MRSRWTRRLFVCWAHDLKWISEIWMQYLIYEARRRRLPIFRMCTPCAHNKSKFAVLCMVRFFWLHDHHKVFWWYRFFSIILTSHACNAILRIRWDQRFAALSPSPFKCFTLHKSDFHLLHSLLIESCFLAYRLKARVVKCFNRFCSACITYQVSHARTTSCRFDYRQNPATR